MKLEISIGVWTAIMAEAEASPDAEICGLLLGEGLRVDGAIPCPNIAADTRSSFEIDPRSLIAAHREARAGGARVVGHYHSHPAGPARPSMRDAAHAAGDGAIWLIAGSGTIGAWRSEAPGSFSAMEVTCVADRRSPQGGKREGS